MQSTWSCPLTSFESLLECSSVGDSSVESVSRMPFKRAGFFLSSVARLFSYSRKAPVCFFGFLVTSNY